MHLVSGEEGRSSRRTTASTEAYDLYLRSIEHFHKFTQSDNAETRRLLVKALEIDPDFTAAMVWLGWAHYIDVTSGWAESPLESWQAMLENANRAKAMDDLNGEADGELAFYYMVKEGQHDVAVKHAKRAVELDLPTTPGCS